MKTYLNAKIFLLHFLFLTSFFSLSANAQWTYPKDVAPFMDDLVITYDVIYERELTEKQKKHPYYIEEVIVNFNKKKLIERKFGFKTNNQFSLFDYTKEKVYHCYTSSSSKKAVSNNFKNPEIETIKQAGKQKKIAGITCDLSIITKNGKPYEIYHTKKLGLRYTQNYNVNGFVLEYPGFNKYLGSYKVVAKKIDNYRLSPVTYSLKGYSISSSEELTEKSDRYKEISYNMIGEKAPKYKFLTIKNKKISSKDMAGKIVIFNFWFTTCPPCKAEIPALNTLKNKYKDDDRVVFIAVATDQEYKLYEFLKSTRFNYDIVGNGGSSAKRFKVPAYPTNIVVDGNGIIQFYKVGGINKNSINNLSYKIDQALIAPLKN